MTKKKLTDKKRRLEEQIEKCSARLSELKQEHKELTEKIKQAEDAEIIAYIDKLGLTYEQTMQFIQEIAQAQE